MVQQSYLKFGLTAIIGIFLMAVFIHTCVSYNPSEDDVHKEGQTMSWEEYIKDREERNLAKMNRTYMEMMSLGRVLVSEGRYGEAIERFYTAKTLFPYRIEPRKNLCYSFLMRCPDNGRFCRLAKREIYYALQHVKEDDIQSIQYLEQLVELVQMDDILSLPEGEAMAAIF